MPVEVVVEQPLLVLVVLEVLVAQVVVATAALVDLRLLRMA
jgi:hypothetical protein